jgi:glycosyltransferase involved in cell wall biosynthesis
MKEENLKKNRIAWVTADYFLDCDISILPHLESKYSITWFVLLPTRKSRFSKEEINKIDRKGRAFFFEVKYRFRDIRMIGVYLRLVRTLLSIQPDLVYFNLQGFPYFAFIVALFLKKKKVVFAVHQAVVHKGMKFRLLTSGYFKFLYSFFSCFHLFSKTQFQLFQIRHPQKKLFFIPLAIKDYGIPTIEAPQDQIVFLNFGNIISSKNISLLINAACNIYEEGYRDFKVRIYGACDNWNDYQKLIKFPEIFDLKIQLIENSHIADLFTGSHYLVLPYSSVSQSGPLKIAFNYNVPVIASNLEEFKNEIKDEITGFLFESNNLADLIRVMKQVLDDHHRIYNNLKNNLSVDVANRYGEDMIMSGYDNMFQSILSNENEENQRNS